MYAVNKYDKNDPKSWPDKAKDGQYVLCKTDKSKCKMCGIYQYEVMNTDAMEKCDFIVAWMRIPTELRLFGEKPIKDMPGQPNPCKGDIGVIDNMAYIYDGETWIYYMDLEEYSAVEKMKADSPKYCGTHTPDYLKFTENHVYRDMCCINGETYLFDGKEWQKVERSWIEHDKALTDEKRHAELVKMHLDMIRDEERTLNEILLKSLMKDGGEKSAKDWIIYVGFLIIYLIGFWAGRLCQ